MTSPIPLYGYARQSLTRDGSESIPIQVESGEKGAARLGGKIVRWFIEAPSTSGYKNRGRSRAEFSKMLAALPSGEAQGIMVYKTDRLSRGGGPGWAPVFDAIEAAGLNCDRAVATPNGWMSEYEIATRAASDREYSKQLSDRMLDVRAREAQAGKPRQGGRRPFGYDRDLMTVIPAEAEMIVEAAERVVMGESPWAVAKSWNLRGSLRPPGGGDWNAVTVKRIIRSGRVAGQREHLGEIAGDATWPAILDRTTAEQVRLVLAGRATAAPVVRPRSFLLSGFLRCACGARLVTRRRKGGPPSKPGLAARREYVCQTKESGGSRHPSCGSLVIHADPIEDDVRDVVFGAVLDPVTMERLSAAAPTADDGRDLGAEIRDLNGQQKKLTDLYQTTDKMTKRDYLARVGDIEDRLAALHAELTAIAEHPILATLPTTLPALKAKWQAEGIEWRQLLVKAVVASLTVKRGRAAKIADRLVYDMR